MRKRADDIAIELPKCCVLVVKEDLANFFYATVSVGFCQEMLFDSDTDDVFCNAAVSIAYDDRHIFIAFKFRRDNPFQQPGGRIDRHAVGRGF